MSLTYKARNVRIDDFDANVACAAYLYKLHMVLGLPVHVATSSNRVPYSMDKATAERCAEKIHEALSILGASPDDQPDEIGIEAHEARRKPTSTALIAESWAEFLEHCCGYEVV